MDKEEHDSQKQALQEQLQREVRRRNKPLLYVKNSVKVLIVTYVAASVFTHADGTVSSFQSPADGAAGDVTVEVQSYKGLKNTAFTNTTRCRNACFSHSTTSNLENVA